MHKNVAIRRYGSVGELRAALYEALQTEPPVFGSSMEKRAVEALESDVELTEQQWDQIFLLLEDDEVSDTSHRHILRLLTKDHLDWLANNAPDLLSAYGGYFCDYLDDSEGELDFDYCDVAADKLGWLFHLGDVSIQARCLISLMIMGAAHNRWYVEHKFVKLAGPNLDEAIADRFIADIDVRDINFERYISHIERSINAKKESLNPALHVLWNEHAA